MFFYLSKILWFFATPSNLIVGAMIAGTALAFSRRFARFGRGLAALGAAAFLLLATGPGAASLVGVLERRFAPYQSEKEPPPDGIVVLGGTIGEAEVAPGVWQIVMNEGAERLTEGMALARRFPNARLVFTGGSAALFHHERTEAQAARDLWRSLGYPVDKAIFEEKSRNTVENAVFTAELVKPKPGERWLLVTSAYHMPRSIGIFRKAGFEVIAAPVDFRTSFKSANIAREAARGLELLDLGVREWIGLVAYYVTGKSSALLPKP
jgi:uncharacterized SAM-binding protein YcdF (DUF218 family)